MTHRRAPRPLAHAIEALTGRLAPATLLGDVQRVWEQAAGPAIAREAAPVSERGGTVTLECSSAVWMQEIDLMGPGLVAQLNALLGGERVSGVRCVATTGRRGPPRGRG
jgi:predicted nucleic acid-binding Zn ribbon protein